MAKELKPGMRDVELKIICDIINSFKSPMVFEWGCGISTKYFLKHCPEVTNWVAIENDLEWYTRLTKEIIHRKLKIIYCPPIEIRDKDYWYHMEQLDPNATEKYFAKYVTQIRKYSPQVVLIDGRSRFQCLNESYSTVDDETIVLMHDCHRIEKSPEFWEDAVRRWEYSEVFYRKIGIFQKKKCHSQIKNLHRKLNREKIIHRKFNVSEEVQKKGISGQG